MKKLITVLLGMILTISVFMPIKAYADVLWEPHIEGSFYGTHRDIISICGKYYVVNSPDGYVFLYDEPEGKASEYIENGERVYIDFLCEVNGHKWGISRYYDEKGIILDECYEEYDYSTYFRDELGTGFNGDVIVSFNEDYIRWEYPNSEVREKIGFECKEAYPNVHYTDSDGDEWYYFSYVYGVKNFWLNMTNPTSMDRTPFEVYKPDIVYPAKTPSDGQMQDVSRGNKADVTETERKSSNELLDGVSLVEETQVAENKTTAADTVTSPASEKKSSDKTEADKESNEKNGSNGAVYGVFGGLLVLVGASAYLIIRKIRKV